MYKLNKISYMACYTMDEAGALIDRSARTIRAFVADGMPTIDDGKPTLIRGYDLINYLRTKNRVTKNPLKTNEMYCLRCREPIVPLNNNVTMHETGTSLKLSGICPLCGKVANRAYKISAKDLLSGTFHIVDDLSIYDSVTTPSDCRIPESSLPQHPTPEKEGQLCFQL
ncbi:MAG: hypothetical protein K2L25_04085 [Alphaproteobacteria bacterium]|nr:hypothetical protein [Alphaproteobacteria bacterium]